MKNHLRKLFRFFNNPVAKPPQLPARKQTAHYSAAEIGGEWWVLASDGSRLIPHGQNETRAKEQAETLSENVRLSRRMHNLKINYSIRANHAR